MIVYNVTVKVELAIANEWLPWMKSEHIPDVLSTGYFTSGRIFHLMEQNEEDSVTYVVQYFCNEMSDYNAYLQLHATTMREKTKTKFGNQFVAFRTLMSEV